MNFETFVAETFSVTFSGDRWSARRIWLWILFGKFTYIRRL